MFVEKLSVFGFKSFNQKISLGFDKGISGIIGPNGCGKSNIVDAMRWVLGEQSTKQLRGDKMEDVIFNGARNEKPMSLAQVELTLNNDRGALPVDYSTVTVGRRLYRSGASEYLINGNVVRLKDVRDLFLDTGMGSHAYSVIERQMVDNILSDTTGHRRFLFEEAAGIMKYKTRKKEALNKLDATERDLLRVNDIITEVERQVASLKRQVSKARRYKTLIAEIRNIDLGLSQQQRQDWKSTLDGLEQRWRVDSVDAEQAETKVAALDAHLEALQLAVVEEEKKLMAAREALAEVDDSLGRAENRSTALRERLQATKDKIKEASEHQVRLADRLERTTGQLTDGAARLDELVEREHIESEKLHAGEAALSQAEKAFTQAKDSAESARAALVKHQETVSSRQTAVATTAHRIEDLKAAIARIDAESGETRKNADGFQEELARTKKSLDSVRTVMSELGEEQDRLETQWSNHRNRLEIHRKELSHHRESDAAMRSRLETLENLRDSYDGFAPGVRALMSEEQRPAGVVGTISDLVTLPGEWLRALEPVLSPAWQYIVVEDTNAAVQLIDRLKGHELGFASMVPLDKVPRTSEPEPGTIWASEVIEAAPEYRPLLRHLLEGLALAPSLDEALALVRSGKARSAATSTGEFVDGIVLSGGVGGQAPGSELLEREEGLARCRREIEHLTMELSRLQDREAELKQEEEELSGRQAELERRLKEAGVEASSLEQQGKEHQLHLTHARASVEKFVQEVQQLNAEIDRLEEANVENERVLTDSKNAAAQAESQYAESTREAQIAEQAKDAALAALHDLRVDWARLEGELKDAKSTHDRLIQEQAEIKQDQARTTAEAEDAVRRQGEIEQEASEVADKIQELHRLREERAEVAAAREREKAEAVAKEHKDAELVREERRKASASRNRAHEAEVEVTRIRSELQHLEGRLREEYEITPQELDVFVPEPLPENPAQELSELRDRMRRLGPVNHMALEEYEEKSERFEFMSTQRDDLLSARDTLVRTITEINKKAAGMFLDTFAVVQANFQKTFQVLFQGGECTLDLVGDDPLEAEIDVTARPRGKRPQSIAQLSSGERALTAIALLFAIYLVKPSPFCILDEVDAPLDDANIDRFVAMIKEFSKRTQFIMITHNKKTMEAADCLYGITMQRPGVSSVVSVRLDGGALDAEAKAALEGAKDAEREEKARRVDDEGAEEDNQTAAPAEPAVS